MILADTLFLIVGLFIILLAAEFFTNGVEHLGVGLNLGEGAVGSVLAAVGTALPETFIPMVAILLGSSAQSHSIGIGAIIGAPFMLSTLAFTVTALAVLIFRRRRRSGALISIKTTVLARDLLYFLPMYSLAIATTWLPQGWPRWVVCACLLLAYVHYVRANLKEGGEIEASLKPLRLKAMWLHLSLTRLPEETREAFLHRLKAASREGPHTLLSLVQVLIAIIIMLLGAQLFVRHVESLSLALGVSSLIVALIVAPIATELPEKFNSVLWIRESKDTLAVGNITGAMVFQSTFPVILGIGFTNWELQNHGLHGNSALISAGIALASASFVLLYARLNSGKDSNRIQFSPLVLLAGLPLYLFFLFSLYMKW